jgi:hypothetical protein
MAARCLFHFARLAGFLAEGTVLLGLLMKLAHPAQLDRLALKADKASKTHAVALQRAANSATHFGHRHRDSSAHCRAISRRRSSFGSCGIHLEAFLAHPLYVDVGKEHLFDLVEWSGHNLSVGRNDQRASRHDLKPRIHGLALQRE